MAKRRSVKSFMPKLTEKRRLRWARNVVKKWQSMQGSWEEFRGMEATDPQGAQDLVRAIKARRYKRAAALLAAHRLTCS